MKNILPDRSILAALGVLALIVLLIIPLPALLLDILTALVLITAILIPLNIAFTKKNTVFSLLPTCLLALTLFGLVIQISFTRLILTHGEAFNGRIIRIISSLVTGSNGLTGIVVGCLVFAFLTLVMGTFVVMGASRVAEAAARFTLDGLPGKQMAIDAEYSSGIISQEEHNAKKQELQQEVDFYASLDGVSKFISGNFKVSIFITIVSILGGCIINIASGGIIFNGEALENGNLFLAITISPGFIENLIWIYIPFSIANGLLAQFMVLLRCIAVSLSVSSLNSESSSQSIK